jgi:hypothetical protein
VAQLTVEERLAARYQKFRRMGAEGQAFTDAGDVSRPSGASQERAAAPPPAAGRSEQ